MLPVVTVVGRVDASNLAELYLIFFSLQLIATIYPYPLPFCQQGALWAEVLLGSPSVSRQCDLELHMLGYNTTNALDHHRTTSTEEVPTAPRRLAAITIKASNA